MALALFAFVVSSGCAQKETYGEEISKGEVTPIGAILARPADYVDREVRVVGKITLECSSGCWFKIEDDSGEIYVTIAAYGLAIPQKVGKKVKVEGRVASAQGGRLMVVGKGVEI